MKPINFIDKTAEIGEGSTVWHFATILQDVKVGKNCSIGSHAEIGRGTVIGDGTRISALVFLPPNSRVGKNVFIAPHAMFCDDKHPRAGNAEYLAQPPIIEEGAVIGANATILPGVRIGEFAVVGAGSVVTHNVEPWTTVYGVPARAKYKTREQHDIYAPRIRERVIAGEHVRERA